MHFLTDTVVQGLNFQATTGHICFAARPHSNLHLEDTYHEKRHICSLDCSCRTQLCSMPGLLVIGRGQLIMITHQSNQTVAIVTIWKWFCILKRCWYCNATAGVSVRCTADQCGRPSPSSVRWAVVCGAHSIHSTAATSHNSSSTTSVRWMWTQSKLCRYRI